MLPLARKGAGQSPCLTRFPFAARALRICKELLWAVIRAMTPGSRWPCVSKSLGLS